jgi:hypothetical protein
MLPSQYKCSASSYKKYINSLPKGIQNVQKSIQRDKETDRQIKKYRHADRHPFRQAQINMKLFQYLKAERTDMQASRQTDRQIVD